jgi:hypothetical protein
MYYSLMFHYKTLKFESNGNFQCINFLSQWQSFIQNLDVWLLIILLR